MEDCTKNITLTQSPEWGRGNTQSIDFIVTEDCNLRCKYCYICHKKADKVMNFITAKKFIDYIFSDNFTREPGVILDFIGGEPFLETELIDKVVDYFKIKAYMCNSSWWWNYRISLTTNGINYSSPKVQRFISKNKEKLSITITIDGTKEKHDMQRVFSNGSGSYDIIAKSIPLYLSQFTGTTKVTFAHDDLPLLKESVIHLWELGINDISANVVFEDVWEDGDDAIFEDQLKSLADYIIENETYHNNFVSLFDEYIGKPLTEEHTKRPVCGAGRMIALGPSGNIYPCLRYKDYSLESDKKEIVIGHVDTGIDFNKVLRFRVSTYPMQCDDECLNCEIALGCMFCQGQSYDSADTPTNFQRSKFICKMHKARVRANNYYFNRLYNEKEIERTDYGNEYKKMYFITSSDFTTFCEVNNETTAHSVKMRRDTLENSLKYCGQNFFTPVFLHSNSELDYSLFSGFNEYRITHIVSAKFYETTKQIKNCIYAFNADTYDIEFSHLDYCILNVSWSEIESLSKYLLQLFENCDRINLNLLGIPSDNDLLKYDHEQQIVSEYLRQAWQSEGAAKEFNKLTDVLFVGKQSTCRAGVTDFTIAPDGNFYVCPQDYLDRVNAIGNLRSGNILVKNQHLYTLKYAALCKECPSKQCVRCQAVNKEGSGEVNIPPFYKCKTAIQEYKQSVRFKEQVQSLYPQLPLRNITDFEYDSPYEAYEQKMQSSLGFHIAN